MERTRVSLQAGLLGRVLVLTASLALLLGAVLCCGVMQANATGELGAQDLQNTFNASDASPTITTDADLAAFAAAVNGGNTFEGKTITVSSSAPAVLNLSTPIGNDGNHFKGSFDGNYRTFNLNISGVGWIGMFGAVEGRTTESVVTIRNLVVTGSVISANPTPNFDHTEAGGVVGYSYGYVLLEQVGAASGLTVSNEYGSAGGLVGRCTDDYSTGPGSIEFRRCFSRANVMGLYYSCNAAGGFVGENFVPITCSDCYSTTGTVSGLTDVQYQNWLGGFAGWIGNSTYPNSTLSMSNCYAARTLSGRATGDYLGIICGLSGEKVTATNSFYAPQEGLNLLGDSENSVAGLTSKAPEQLKALLPSSSYVADDPTNPINGGYPILSWERNVTMTVAKPTPTTGLVWDGTSKTGVAAGTGYTVTNGTATNAGSYTAVATLSEGFVWSDGSTDPVSISWSIGKASPTIALSPSSLELNAFDDRTSGKNVTVSYGGDGVVSATVTDGIGRVYATYENGVLNVRPLYTGTASVNATVTVSAAASDNCNAATAQTLPITVTRKEVAKPTAATGLVYNGSEQTGVAAGAGYTVTDGAKTAPGNYTATASLSSGCVWSDGTWTNCTLPWSIAVADLADATVTGIEDGYEVTTGWIVPVPTVMIGGSALPASDYRVSYGENTVIGSGTVTITPTGTNLTGDPRVITFAITEVAERPNVTVSGGVEAAGGIFADMPDDTAWLELSVNELDDAGRAAALSGYTLLIGNDEVAGVFNVDLLQHKTDGTVNGIKEGVGAVTLSFPVNAADGTSVRVVQLHENGTSTPDVIEHSGLVVSDGKVNVTLDGRLSTFAVLAENSSGSGSTPNPSLDSGKTGDSGKTDNSQSASGKSDDSKSTSNPAGTVKMLRLYNPNSGEHFYTADEGECDHLASLGWQKEGTGWIAPETSSTPVYRLYNEAGGEHHYTMDAAEKDWLVSIGWKFESIGWYSDDAKGQVLYREYNPNAFSNNHNYTTSEKEHQWLLGLGWNDEGKAWYGVAAE